MEAVNWIMWNSRTRFIYGKYFFLSSEREKLLYNMTHAATVVVCLCLQGEEFRFVFFFLGLREEF